MNENTITKEKMDAMKDLAQTNIKVSEARNLLFKLQEEETTYLEIRENKVMDRIKINLEESRSFIDETKGNWSEVKNLFTVASDMVNSIGKIYKELHETVEDFVSRNDQWERDIGKQNDDIREMKKEMKLERELIENDKKTIKVQKKQIEQDKILIESRQAQIKSALELLKKQNGN